MNIKNVAAAMSLGFTALIMLMGGERALAQDAPGAEAGETASASPSPLHKGAYLTPMAFHLKTDDKDLDDGVSGSFSLGYRNGLYGVEIGGVYADLSGPTQRGAIFKGLLFPFQGSLPNLFLSAGVGALAYEQHPNISGDFHTMTTEAGLGYLFPMSVGRYEFGVRAEGSYRHGRREKYLDATDVDRPVPRYFNDVLVGIGLQLPLSMPAPPPPPPPPVAVVEPAKICADGQDNDGDGLIDFPADPGCFAADDSNETDPAVCSDGKDNDGDGLIDFPSDKGCAAADDTDEVDPCKTPAPGERISLKGCGLGDVIVLRGVNFEFDQARLTANAKTILDNVGEELTAYPEIEVELSGHTDAKGSDEYNQTLSDKRAAAVKRYLVGKDIADTRMTTVGKGESQPVADNETDEGRELNRRVELKVTKGVAPGGPAVTSEAANPEAPAADVPADPAATDDATPDALAEAVSAAEAPADAEALWP